MRGKTFDRLSLGRFEFTGLTDIVAHNYILVLLRVLLYILSFYYTEKHV